MSSTARIKLSFIVECPHCREEVEFEAGEGSVDDLVYALAAKVNARKNKNLGIVVECPKAGCGCEITINELEWSNPA